MIDLSNIRKPKIDYYPTTMTFESIITGQLRVHHSTPDFLDLILFDERICSFFRVFRLLFSGSPVSTILLDTISELEYRPSSLQPDITEKVRDLRISDIKEYSHLMLNRVLISDYQRGLFITSMKCEIGEGCQVEVQSLLRRLKIDKIEQT